MLTAHALAITSWEIVIALPRAGGGLESTWLEPRAFAKVRLIAKPVPVDALRIVANRRGRGGVGRSALLAGHLRLIGFVLFLDPRVLARSRSGGGHVAQSLQSSLQNIVDRCRSGRREAGAAPHAVRRGLQAARGDGDVAAAPALLLHRELAAIGAAGRAGRGELAEPRPRLDAGWAVRTDVLREDRGREEREAAGRASRHRRRPAHAGEARRLVG